MNERTRIKDEDWIEYRRLILDNLSGLDDRLDDVETDVAELKTMVRLIEQTVSGKVSNTDFQVMKTKVSFWATIAAALVTTACNIVIRVFF
jgi:hypothetical protein